jgi:hypothetical protein
MPTYNHVTTQMYPPSNFGEGKPWNSGCLVESSTRVGGVVLPHMNCKLTSWPEKGGVAPAPQCAWRGKVSNIC